MNIGFANIYSFRPHVEHLFYLSSLMKSAGHNVFFLTCDAGLTSCYPRLLKGTSKLVECPKCMLGGIRSYPVNSVTPIARCGKYQLNESELDLLTMSSSCTLTRIEADNESNDPEVISIRRALHDPVSLVYGKTCEWIDQNELDAVVCFNGRMDVTRAIIYACQQRQVPFVTHERTWFGNGLQLIPNANCLSIFALNKMAGEYENRPLLGVQANIAGKLAAERFLQRNSLEWRLYNKNPHSVSWPLETKGKRVLILPSSKNEFADHHEWKTGWRNNTQALDDFFEAFSIKPTQIVLRCHPNWAENIGKIDGNRSLAFYKSWAERRSIYCIASGEKASTYDLIQQADIVVMNGGSSAIEAGVCGKQVVCLGPAGYESAGFVRVFKDQKSLTEGNPEECLDSETIIRKALRFIYLASNRFPQYVDYVRAIETTRYQYYGGADPERLVSMLKTGEVVADDDRYAVSSAEEDEVVEHVKNKNWEFLANFRYVAECLPQVNISRRAGLRWVDHFRAKFPRGDLG